MFNPSWPEVVTFLFLFGASLYAFWRRFRVVVHKIRESKRDAGFHLQPVSKRVRNFAWEVLLQGKVIRERPLPGLAHAFVFWGFCSFALVTLNHLAQGAGLGFLAPDSWIRKVSAVFA